MYWNSYEISLWNHQEEFLTVLCNSQNFQKYDVYSPVLNNSTTGQGSLTFSIPIKVLNLKTGVWEDNTVWYNSLRANKNLANEQRVKLIFDKDDKARRRIFQMVITNLQQVRNNQQLICNVTCSGLAFQWLGKIGYSLVLDNETALLQEEEAAENGDPNFRVNPTINYWLDKVFPNHQENGKVIWDTFWRYKIDMKYKGYVGDRDTKHVYEDDDVISYQQQEDGSLISLYNTQPIEKQRFIEISGSNKYNITQAIAEEFQVFARYQFLYEDASNPYKATAGIVVFYNEEINDSQYVISYANNQLGLTKTSQSKDIVTKMYVDPVEDQYSDNGFVALSEADANKMGQEYLLNFDYYIQSGQMTARQIGLVNEYELTIRRMNQDIDECIKLRDQYDTLVQDELVKVANAKDGYESAAQLVNDYNNKLSIIKKSLNTQKSKLTQSIVLIIRQENGIGKVNFTRDGIAWKDMKSKTKQFDIANATPKFNQFKFVTQLTFPLSAIEYKDTDGKTKLLTTLELEYSYNLTGFYNAIIAEYSTMRDKKQSEYETSSAKLGLDTDKIQGDTPTESDTTYAKYNYYKAQYKQKAQQKNSIIEEFENELGYFIKQGSWNAQNFSASTETKTKQSPKLWEPGFDVPNFSATKNESETKSYYLQGVNETKVYYDYIVLTEECIKGITDYNTFCIVEKWKDAAGDSHESIYYNNALGSIQFLRFKIINDTKYPQYNDKTYVAPVFLFDNSNNQVDPTRSNFGLYYKYNSKDTQHPILTQNFHRVNDDNYKTLKFTVDDKDLSFNPKGTVVFRRIVIKDQDVSDFELTITDAENYKIKQNESYLFYKVNGVKTVTFKITDQMPVYFWSKTNGVAQPASNVKPTVLPLTVTYTQDHSPQRLYFDARDVLKTSAFPEVSYDVNFVYLQKAHLPKLNTQPMLNDNIDIDLGSIVRINDKPLGLSNIKGIVTQYSLDLDSPQNTTFTISNYKTRFEDLFGRIVADTQALEAKSASYDRAANAFSPTGEINVSILQSTISSNNLIFSSGYDSNVSWDKDGILVENTAAYANGVMGRVLIKGGGILLSNTKDGNGNYLYTSAITPNGINADAITAGRINTEKISVYSGDQIRFVWNAQGLFAYGEQALDSREDAIITNFIRYNQDGLYFYRNAVPVLTLDWDGLYIGAQDGGIQLTGDDGLIMYNATKYDGNGTLNTERQMRLHLGRYTEDNVSRYGFRLFNQKGNPTLVTDNNGQLWLKDKLSVGSGNSMSGISGETLSNQNSEIISSPVRIWAGATYANRNSAPFYVLQDGTLHATKAYIGGQISAKSGTIGGWTISENKLSAIQKKGQQKASLEILDEEGNVITSLGNGDMKFTGEIYATSGSFTGEIHATSGSFQGTITATGGSIGGLSIASILGDTDVIRIQVESSAGNITTYGQEFTTSLTAKAYKGNIQFSDQEYNNYDYSWYISFDGKTWKKLELPQDKPVPNSHIIDKYINTFEEQAYIKCEFKQKSKEGI